MSNQAPHVGTVLLVEDDQDIMLLTSTYLESLGYQVVPARNGDMALKSLESMSDTIDVVLTDVVMPEKDGLTLCAEIRANATYKNIPIVMISAKVGVQDKLAGYNAGADDYLTKPIQLQELKTKMVSLMEYKIQNRQLTEELKNTKMATQTILRYYSDIGHILEFFTNSLQATSFKALTKSLFTTLAALDLKAVIQYRYGEKTEHFSSTGAVSPLEASLMHLTNVDKRFIEHGQRLLLNHKYFSILIKNLPVADAERTGAIKDTLGTLGNILEVKSQMLFVDEITTNNENILALVHGTVGELSEMLDNLQQKTHKSASKLLEDMDSLFIRLGLTEIQEDTIRELIVKSQNEFDEALDQGALVKKHFEEIENSISNIKSTKI